LVSTDRRGFAADVKVEVTPDWVVEGRDAGYAFGEIVVWHESLSSKRQIA
jgi:hypothetical protein